MRVIEKEIREADRTWLLSVWKILHQRKLPKAKSSPVRKATLTISALYRPIKAADFPSEPRLGPVEGVGLAVAVVVRNVL
jgi:hypothetical protein